MVEQKQRPLASSWRIEKERHFPTDLLSVKKTLTDSAKAMIKNHLGIDLKEFDITFPVTASGEGVAPAFVSRKTNRVTIPVAGDIFEKYLKKAKQREADNKPPLKITLGLTGQEASLASKAQEKQAEIAKRDMYNVAPIEPEDVDTLAGLLGHEIGHIIHGSNVLVYKDPSDDPVANEQFRESFGELKPVSAVGAVSLSIAESLKENDKTGRYEVAIFR